jgi:hypothetical protein
MWDMRTFRGLKLSAKVLKHQVEPAWSVGAGSKRQFDVIVGGMLQPTGQTGSGLVLRQRRRRNQTGQQLRPIAGQLANQEFRDRRVIRLDTTEPLQQQAAQRQRQQTRQDQPQ